VNYSLEIRSDAIADIEEAAEWYESKQPGLGIGFTRTVMGAIETLPANPLIHRLRDRRRNVRWVRAHRFPYRVVYQVRDEVITVVAILHLARLDRHWKHRL
jgi:plasmid stabilization system protein ParE